MPDLPAGTDLPRTEWPSVAALALHYLAAGAVLGTLAYLTATKTLDPAVLVAFLGVSGGGVAVKFGSK